MDFKEAIEKRTKRYEDQYPEANVEWRAFEDLCKFYLENGPWGKSGRVRVWKWGDAGNPLTLNAPSEKDRKKQDTGCDLVAEDDEGKRYAVQCKYYPKSTLSLDEAHLANIVPLAERYEIPKDRIIFCYIAKDVSRQADDLLSQYTCIRENDLDNPDFDWGPMFGVKKRAPKELREYQKKAIEACINGFRKEEEKGEKQVGKLIMACGTGKTFTSLSL